MKALQIQNPDHATITTIDDPGAPGEGEVRLQIKTMGICGTDLSSYRGVNPLVSYPRVPGHEISAVIHALGPNVPDECKVGDTVTVYPYTNCGECASCKNNRHHACEHNATLGVQREGAFTEYINQPWEKLIRADGLSYAETALIEPMAVGFHAVERGQTTQNDIVVVFGCGAIGLGCICGAAARNATIVAIDLDDHKLQVAKAAGAAHLINGNTEDVDAKIADLTNGLGADVVIEAVGTPATFTKAIDIVSFTGRVVYIGYSKAPVTYDTAQFVKKELDIRGSRNATRQNFEEVIAALRADKIPVDQIVTQNVPLADSPTALDNWDKNGADIVKIHVQIDE
jgi:2-desacetyl-2-hydroxyethyl bacteriochlorophyllide A dehydrogenase